MGGQSINEIYWVLVCAHTALDTGTASVNKAVGISVLKVYVILDSLSQAAYQEGHMWDQGQST